MYPGKDNINASNWSIFIAVINIRKFDNWTNNLMLFQTYCPPCNVVKPAVGPILTFVSTWKCILCTQPESEQSFNWLEAEKIFLLLSLCCKNVMYMLPCKFKAIPFLFWWPCWQRCFIFVRVHVVKNLHTHFEIH